MGGRQGGQNFCKKHGEWRGKYKIDQGIDIIAVFSFLPHIFRDNLKQ